MAHQVTWTKLVLETFIEEGNLTELQERIMRTRVYGLTRVQQCEMFNISMSTLDRQIRILKDRYDEVQRYSVVLPVRKTSKEEEYMDTH